MRAVVLRVSRWSIKVRYVVCQMVCLAGTDEMSRFHSCFLSQLGVEEVRLVMLWRTGLVGKGVRVGKVLSRPCEYMYHLVA